MLDLGWSSYGPGGLSLPRSFKIYGLGARKDDLSRECNEHISIHVGRGVGVGAGAEESIEGYLPPTYLPPTPYLHQATLARKKMKPRGAKLVRHHSRGKNILQAGALECMVSRS